MSVFKCKMCGGTILFNPGDTVGVCDSCGTKQTLPKTNDEMISNLFNRANNLRLKNEFDKAEQIYEKIVQMDDSEAEAHWGIVLCKYGIEYVEDPKTHQRIPTCHRTLYEAVTTDPDYTAAIDYSDSYQQTLYEKEARAIDRIQKGILEIVKNEKPFDVFLCYKETDENGKRTVDSAIANDIYYQLTQEGFKVFYAAITLEDKLGQEYEPYIFSALNTAKVMLVIGTKPEYFNAVWVKNEWSRYLKLMKTDRSRLLIPCYRDMDAYELPEEFAHLQAQDMGKIGFINDVVRGIRKVASKVKADNKEATVVSTSAVGIDIEPLLQRVELFLEDSDWEKADEFCEHVLNIDPKNARAYLYKLMAEQHVCHQEDLKNCANPFDGNKNYQKAMRFGDEKIAAALSGYIVFITERNENTRKHQIYNNAMELMNAAKSDAEFIKAATEFKTVSDYKDANELIEKCLAKGEEARKDSIYQKAKSLMKGSRASNYRSALKMFQEIYGWKDTSDLIEECRKKVEEITEKEKSALIEKRKKEQEKELRRQEEELRRQEAEEHIRRIRLLVEAFLISNSDSISIEELLQKSEKDLRLLEEALTAYDSVYPELEKLESELAKIPPELQRLSTRMSLLGAFSRTEKKALESEIAILETKKSQLKQQINDNKARLYGLRKLNDIQAKAKSVRELISVIQDDSIRINSFQEAFDLYKEDSCLETTIDLDMPDVPLNLWRLKKIDALKFGRYPQTADNKVLPIEWLVLDKKGDSYLVISKRSLEYVFFDKDSLSVLWNRCLLRRWANETFLEAAFTTDEQNRIQETSVNSEEIKTIDKVFLLSRKEVLKYFKSGRKAKCLPTPHCDGYENTLWLRAGDRPGATRAAFINKNGDFGFAVGPANGGRGTGAAYFRPAMWINIDKSK